MRDEYGTSGPDEARQLGLEHGQQTGEEIDRQAVVGHFPRWSDAEVDAYLEGRREGASEDGGMQAAA
jgi:hypothetical protein